MPDRFGPRGVFAFLIPQQNANMHPEYELMRPDGVNNQMYRFDISEHEKVREAVLATLPQCHGCYPDMIITANSIEMRNWSLDIQADYVKQLEDGAKGVPVVTATEATTAALRTLGAKRIAKGAYFKGHDVLSDFCGLFAKRDHARWRRSRLF